MLPAVGKVFEYLPPANRLPAVAPADGEIAEFAAARPAGLVVDLGDRAGLESMIAPPTSEHGITRERVQQPNWPAIQPVRTSELVAEIRRHTADT